MAHPLKKYARFVQRELGRDPSFTNASYQWCLQQVQEHWHFAEGRRAQERKQILLERVKEVARKVHASVLEGSSQV
jgi:hypothetical protein